MSPASSKASPDRPLYIRKSQTILLCPTSIQFNSTYLLRHARSSTCMGAGNTRSGSPSQRGYRDVHERVHIPQDSRKPHRTIIQPNIQQTAPSFQSKMLSGSARLSHSACSLSLRRSQSRKHSQARARRSRKTIHEAQADVTGLTKQPEMNITKENFALTRTWTSLWSQGSYI